MQYIQEFNKRAESYLFACNNWKHVLENENKTAISVLQPQSGDRILHLCAGGIYLKEHCNIPDMYWYDVETNPEFSRISGLPLVSPFELPYPTDFFHRVFVLANFHHSTPVERACIYKEILRVLKPGGCFVIGDVIDGSQQAHFLNDFVNRYNPAGHSGMFYTENEIEHFLSCGFSKVDLAYKTYPWRFHSESEMIDFTKTLFYLEYATLEQIKEELPKYLHVKKEDSGIWWEWNLIYFTCYK
jgi:SAM-dependent methyltransferase